MVKRSKSMSIFRQKTNQMPTDRVFGVTFAVFFLFIAWLKFLSYKYNLSLLFLFVASTFYYSALFVPKILRPFNIAWTNFGALLHSVTSPFIIALVFYLLVVPIGFVMRMLGWDPLNLCFDKQRESYWIKINSGADSKISMQYQFSENRG